MNLTRIVKLHSPCTPCCPGSIPDHSEVSQGIFSMADHIRAFLYTVQGVAESGVAAPWKKSLQSHEDNEMPTNQAGLWQTNPKNPPSVGSFIVNNLRHHAGPQQDYSIYIS